MTQFARCLWTKEIVPMLLLSIFCGTSFLYLEYCTLKGAERDTITLPPLSVHPFVRPRFTLYLWNGNTKQAENFTVYACHYGGLPDNTFFFILPIRAALSTAVNSCRYVVPNLSKLFLVLLLRYLPSVRSYNSHYDDDHLILAFPWSV